MPAIRLSSAFFRKELDVYGDWLAAFAREVLQNSVDAGATSIAVTVDEDTGRVTITDDGCGMTRHTIEEVFFAVGETTKHTGDTVGGYGRARIIICLAQRGYVIRTKNMVVRGGCRAPAGTPPDEYHLEVDETMGPDHPAWVDGCVFEVDLIDDAPGKMASRFRRELYDCSLDAEVTINGSPVYFSPLPDRARRILRDADQRPWGKVYVEPDRVGRLLVRVRGLHMFSRYIPGDSDVTLELTPARSRSVLAASRDTLRGDFRAQLDEFISLLESNQRVALRPDAPPLRRRIGNGRLLTTSRTRRDSPAPADSTPASASGGSPADQPAAALASAHAAQRRKQAARSAAADLPAEDLQVVSRAELDHQLPFDTYLLADTFDAPTRALARRWSPEHWDHATGSRRRALLLTWTAAVSYAFDRLLHLYDSIDELAWTTGWTFDSDVKAVCQVRPEATVIALRPVDDSGRTAYRISQQADRWRLLTIAVHEVAHVVASGHDEDFASTLTELMALVDPREADRVMQDRSF